MTWLPYILPTLATYCGLVLPVLIRPLAMPLELAPPTALGHWLWLPLISWRRPQFLRPDSRQHPPPTARTKHHEGEGPCCICIEGESLRRLSVGFFSFYVILAFRAFGPARTTASYAHLPRILQLTAFKSAQSFRLLST